MSFYRKRYSQLLQSIPGLLIPYQMQKKEKIRVSCSGQQKKNKKGDEQGEEGEKE